MLAFSPYAHSSMMGFHWCGLDRTSCAFGSTSCLAGLFLGSKFGSCLTLNLLLLCPSLNARPHFNYTSLRFLCAHGWAQKGKQELRQDAAILAKQQTQRTTRVRETAQDVRAITWLTTDLDMKLSDLKKRNLGLYLARVSSWIAHPVRLARPPVSQVYF